MTETGKDGMLYRNLMIVAGLIVAAFCATATAAQPSGDLKTQTNRGTIGPDSGGTFSISNGGSESNTWTNAAGGPSWSARRLQATVGSTHSARPLRM